MIGQGGSFLSDEIDIYTQDFYSLPTHGFADGSSSLEALADDAILAAIFSSGSQYHYHHCKSCGITLCQWCGGCHTTTCEAYRSQLDCEIDDCEESSRRLDDLLLECLELIDDAVGLRYSSLEREAIAEQKEERRAA